MEEASEQIERADPVELVVRRPRALEEAESAGSEEPSVIRDLMQRARVFARANRSVTTISSTSSVQGNNLQAVLDQVAAQHPDDSSSSDGEKCGVYSRSFRNRPRASARDVQGGFTRRVV